MTLFVGVLADGEMHLVILEGKNMHELGYTTSEIEIALDNHFACGINNLEYSVLEKQSSDQLFLKVDRIDVEEDEG